MNKAPLFLARVEDAQSKHQQAAFPVIGDCLEGASVVDGGQVAVDFTRFPAPPRHKRKGGDGSFDLCLCYAVFPGHDRPSVMCKRYDGVWGSQHMVSTCYRQGLGKFRMDCGMAAEKIFGVIYASWVVMGNYCGSVTPPSSPPY